MSNRKTRMSTVAILFFIAAGLSLIAGLLPLVKQLSGAGAGNGGVTAVFLGVAVVFFVVGIASSKRNRGVGDSGGSSGA